MIRVFPPCSVLLCVCLCGILPCKAATHVSLETPLEQILTDFSAQQRELLQAAMEPFRHKTAYMDTIINKLQEGLSKGAPKSRIVQTVQRMAKHLNWLLHTKKELFSTYRASQEDILVGQVLSLLMSGVEQKQLHLVFRMISEDKSDPVKQLPHLVEPYLFLRNRLHVPDALSWEFSLELFKRGIRYDSLNRLMVLFGRAHQRNGSCIQEVDYAITLIKQGKSIRRIRMALREFGR